MRKNNTEFLKLCIADAIIEILKTTPFEKISINEITTKAGVGRATYFRNFSSKTEAITFKIITLWSNWCEKNGQSPEDQLTFKNSVDFFNFSYENKELYKLLYNTGLQGTIYDAFYSVIMKQQRSTPEEYYKSRFLSYGVYGIVNEWVKRDFKEPPNDIAMILKNSIKSLQIDI
jgi:hypothetical protein